MNRTNGGVANTLMVLALIVIIMAGLKTAQALVVPFLLAGFITVVCSSPMNWLAKKGLPNWLSLLCVLVGVVVICCLAGLFLTSSLTEFSTAVPEYQDKLIAITKSAVSWLKTHGITIPADLPDKYLNPATLLKYSAQLLNELGTTLANGALILVTVLMMLFEVSSLPRKLGQIFNNPEKGQERLGKIVGDIQTYMAMKTLVSLATGVLVCIFLLIMDIDFPFLWGFLAFALNYVPNIGSIIAAVPALLITLIDKGCATAGIVALFYVAVNVVVGSVLEPMLMGRKVNLSTLVVFMSLIFWGWLLGPVGMFLSVPLTMIVKIALESDQNTKWVAILLGS